MPDFIGQRGQNTPTSINNIDFTPTNPALQEINLGPLIFLNPRAKSDVIGFFCSLQHDQLMSEGDYLGSHRSVASSTGEKGGQRH